MGACCMHCWDHRYGPHQLNSIKTRTVCGEALSFPHCSLSVTARIPRPLPPPTLQPTMDYLAQYDSDMEGEVEVRHAEAGAQVPLPAVLAEPLEPPPVPEVPEEPPVEILVTTRVRRRRPEPAVEKRKSRKKKKVRWARTPSPPRPPVEDRQPATPPADVPLQQVGEPTAEAGTSSQGGQTSGAEQPTSAGPENKERLLQECMEMLEEHPLLDKPPWGSDSSTSPVGSPSYSPPTAAAYAEEEAMEQMEQMSRVHEEVNRSLERISQEAGSYLLARQENREEEYRRSHPNWTWIEDFLAAHVGGREEEFLFEHPAGFAQEFPRRDSPETAEPAASGGAEDEPAVRRRRKGKAPMDPGPSGEPPSPPPSPARDNQPEVDARELAVVSPEEAEAPDAEGTDTGGSPPRTTKRRPRPAEEEPLSADDPGWMRLERAPSANHIAHTLPDHEFAFTCHQGRVRLKYSRDVRDQPPPSLLAVPQYDVLPFKWTANFCRLSAEQRRENVPWWDPRISDEMVRRNTFGLTKTEKKLRAAASVNRRNLHRTNHKWYEAFELAYSGPKMSYRRSHNKRLNRQRHRLREAGLEVLDKQVTHPSEDELTDEVSDGGTSRRVRRGLSRRRQRAARPVAAPQRRRPPPVEVAVQRPPAQVAEPTELSQPPSATDDTQVLGDVPKVGVAETARGDGTPAAVEVSPAPEEGVPPRCSGTPSAGDARPTLWQGSGLYPADAIGASVRSTDSMRDSTHPYQEGWTLRNLMSNTYHQYGEIPRVVTYTTAMRDHFVLLNAVAVRHFLWTAFGAATTNSLYSVPEHMVLDVFTARNFRMPGPRPATNTSTATTDAVGQGPSSPPTRMDQEAPDEL